MNLPNSIPKKHIDRLKEVLDVSWRIYKSQFVGECHPTSTEAPFQHHLANIIATVGQLYCISREDIFHVDLETKVEGVLGKRKFIDITCEFVGRNASCAIELKFKTKKQGAQNHGRVDAYIDIEALECVTENKFSLGRFYMITDSEVYIKKSLRGVGTVFATHEGYVINPETIYSYPDSVGRQNVVANFCNPHIFEWENSEDWHFLELKF